MSETPLHEVIEFLQQRRDNLLLRNLSTDHTAQHEYDCIQACRRYLEEGKATVEALRAEIDALRATNAERLLTLKALAATARTFRNVPAKDQQWTSLDDDALGSAFEIINRAESESVDPAPPQTRGYAPKYRAADHHGGLSDGAPSPSRSAPDNGFDDDTSLTLEEVISHLERSVDELAPDLDDGYVRHDYRCLKTALQLLRNGAAKPRQFDNLDSTHTPGPWVIIDDVPDAAIGYRAIVAVESGELGQTICNPSPMGDANAQLIAAAPRMVNALKSAQDLFQYALPKFNWAASALDAKAIQLLNEVPSVVNAAIDEATPSGPPEDRPSARP